LFDDRVIKSSSLATTQKAPPSSKTQRIDSTATATQDTSASNQSRVSSAVQVILFFIT
jgi:hypothetical protein